MGLVRADKIHSNDVTSQPSLGMFPQSSDPDAPICKREVTFLSASWGNLQNFSNLAVLSPQAVFR